MFEFLLALTLMILPPVPGAIDPSVTQANIKTTICVPGYARAARKKATIVGRLKVAQMKQYGLPGRPSGYEEDHLISIEIGGAPNDPANLWPETYKGPWNAHVKDKLEDRLHTLVCSGQISLQTAQTAIASNWITAYQQYVGTN